MSRIDFDGGYFSLVNDTTGASELRAYYYVTDHLGSVRAVCDGESGAVVKRMEYMPSGLVFSKMWYDNNRHPRYFCGKEELPMEELRLYDSYARFQDTHTPRFTTMDPLCEQYYSVSPYAYCFGDPINAVDPIGTDTINISYVGNEWKVGHPIMAEGNDVFTVTRGGETETYEFSEGEYGKRVDMLNLKIGETKGSYTLGVYHVSGEQKNGTGFLWHRVGHPVRRKIVDVEYPTVNTR